MLGAGGCGRVVLGMRNGIQVIAGSLYTNLTEHEGFLSDARVRLAQKCTVLAQISKPLLSLLKALPGEYM